MMRLVYAMAGLCLIFLACEPPADPSSPPLRPNQIGTEAPKEPISPLELAMWADDDDTWDWYFSLPSGKH